MTPTIVVATVINDAFANEDRPGNVVAPTFPQAFLELAGLPTNRLPVVLRQLAGEGSTGLAQTGILAMDSFLALVINPYAGSSYERLRG